MDQLGNKPESLHFEDNIFHFDLHPANNIVVTGMITGQVQCHKYGLEEHVQLWNAKIHKESCRGVAFHTDGSHISSISHDRTIQLVDVETGKVIRVREETHESPLNSLLIIDQNMFATGDDQGVIKVGGDGYLSTWDIRKPEVAAMSDQMEDELLSIALVKNGKKAVVGTQDGVLALWSWGDWGDYKDRITGHPNSIDAICKLDEDSICTGSSDGIIRLVTILPNEFHGVLGDHGEDMPIENLKLSHDKQYLISSGHDDQLQFWNVAHLFQDEEEQLAALEDAQQDASNDNEKVDAGSDDWATDSDDDDDKEKKQKKRKKTAKKMKPEKKSNNRKAAFFADM
ncbi:WD40-repeat-containing domain protein [Mycotypha africana]|uniref:WD40-repeat-containing domain protein n=1 Tax=Mycotypha africana TaxID=64632 RepID=UPI002301305B|nr:WD40-repeat-containing domain protein [Mycotypha africana]KAI8975384.1 WD40-repeat-containing domain protein [Mycotypha africana]